MGNIGKSSSGCSLCRKRKIKASSSFLAPPFTDMISVTRGGPDADVVLKYRSHVQVIDIKSSCKSDQIVHPQTQHWSTQDKLLARLHHEHMTTVKYYTPGASGKMVTSRQRKQLQDCICRHRVVRVQFHHHHVMTSNISRYASSSIYSVSKQGGSIHFPCLISCQI